MTRNAWIPLGQWLALVAMTAEHVARFALPEEWGLAPWATLLGRIALPLFAGMVAWHAVYNTRNPIRYARRLLLIGLIAQLPYMLALDVLRLNICFTLALGLLLITLLERDGWALFLVTSLTALTLTPWLEYGMAGLLLVPAYVIAFRAPDRWFSPLPLLLVAYLINDLWLFSVVSVAVAVVLVVLNAGWLRHTRHVAPMPRRLWLAWYPLHWAAITIATRLLA